MQLILLRLLSVSFTRSNLRTYRSTGVSTQFLSANQKEDCTSEVDKNLSVLDVTRSFGQYVKFFVELADSATQSNADIHSSGGKLHSFISWWPRGWPYSNYVYILNRSILSCTREQQSKCIHSSDEQCSSNGKSHYATSH